MMASQYDLIWISFLLLFVFDDSNRIVRRLNKLDDYLFISQVLDYF